jgi:hypothetical protein
MTSDRFACHSDPFACHSELFACHSERSEESRLSHAQGKLREESEILPHALKISEGDAISSCELPQKKALARDSLLHSIRHLFFA